MSGSRWVPAIVLGTLLASAADALAVDAARLDLLAGEAVSTMGGAVAASPSRGGLLVLLGIPLATMLSAFLGTFFGIRGLSFTSVRDNAGWRYPSDSLEYAVNTRVLIGIFKASIMGVRKIVFDQFLFQRNSGKSDTHHDRSGQAIAYKVNAFAENASHHHKSH